MTVRSKQLGTGTAIGTTNVTLYTCPANTRTIVRQVILFNAGASAITAQINIENGGTQIVGWEVELGARHSATASYINQIWVVLKAGDDLRVNASAGTGLQAIASGAELPL